MGQSFVLDFVVRTGSERAAPSVLSSQRALIAPGLMGAPGARRSSLIIDSASNWSPSFSRMRQRRFRLAIRRCSGRPLDWTRLIKCLLSHFAAGLRRPLQRRRRGNCSPLGLLCPKRNKALCSDEGRAGRDVFCRGTSTFTAFCYVGNYTKGVCN